MNDRHGDPLETLVNQSLDGSLSDQQRTEFADLLSSREFHDALTLQKRIDESVGRRFTAPDPQPLLNSAMNGRWQQYVHRLATVGRARKQIRNIAAGIVLAILGAGVAWQMWPEEIRLPPHQTIEAVYADAVKTGFTPPVTYRDTRSFATAVYSRLGKGAAVSDVPDGVKLLGFGYCHSITPWTVYLMARSNDAPIMLFVDRADADKGQHLAPGSPLHLASRKVDDLVFYEISTLKEPLLLGRAATIPIPNDWLRREQCSP